MKVSVIIPVYKVEKYIEKSIQSLLDQTYTNFEALIIDDGSPDQSINLAKKLVNGDPRFIFLEKKNGGVSSARNMGLDHATGDYIAFLDPDDTFKKNCLNSCYKELSKTNLVSTPSIIAFGYEEIDESTEKVLSQFTPDIQKYHTQEDIFLIGNSINYSVWNKIYRSDIFHNIRFIDGLLYEDKELTPKLLYKQNIKVIREPLYNYLIRVGSLTQSYNKNSLSSYIRIYQNYHEFLKEKNILNKYKSDYEKGYVAYCFYAEYMHIIKQSPNFHEDIELLVQTIDLKKVTLKNIRSYYSVISKPYLAKILFNINPKVLRWIYSFYKKLK